VLNPKSFIPATGVPRDTLAEIRRDLVSLVGEGEVAGVSYGERWAFRYYSRSLTRRGESTHSTSLPTVSIMNRPVLRVGQTCGRITLFKFSRAAVAGSADFFKNETYCASTQLMEV
jgi:hypothetical protein